MLLTGEPGIGKTRLARTLGDQARAAGAAVALARGWDGGGAPSYWPWLQVVRALAAERSDEQLAADLGAGARWVAQIAPELRDRLGLPEAGEAAAESDQARFALFDAVAMFLRRVAADAPVVVLLDDLHTADLPSLLLLAFLARAIGDAARARRLDPSRRGAEARSRGRGRLRRAEPLRAAHRARRPRRRRPAPRSSPTAAAPTPRTTSSAASRP